MYLRSVSPFPFQRVKRACVVPDLALPETARQAIAQEQLARAHDLCPAQYSCRTIGHILKSTPVRLSIMALIAVVVVFPFHALAFWLAWIAAITLATTVLRLSALTASLRTVAIPNFVQAPRVTHLPSISLLVPLFREAKVVSSLLDHLQRLDYPTSKLEILLLLEETDTLTHARLADVTLPSNVSVIEVPKDWLQTKPKAMNYALTFVTGDIVGIYDAEDRPEADQLQKVAAHFAFAPANVACLQARLDFYNSRDNWIARCFTIDYTSWFQLILRGMQTLGVPIPLGGTSVFFRRTILWELGGWDAFNVTEDADLGVRLARFGYRCEMLDSTTWEEANCRALPWIRQRSRWLKGYGLTWLSHMRRPGGTLRDLGWKGFLGVNTILLSGLTSHLAMPLFLIFWALSFGLDTPLFHSLPTTAWWGFVTIMMLSEIAVYLIAIVAVSSEEKRHLLPYILTLPFYWMMGSLAAYKAVLEMLTAPFYWDKTEHGHARQDV